MAGLIRTVKGARNWDVRFSNPQEVKYKHIDHVVIENRNRYAIVIADTAMTAIALILAEYPEATIHQINCKGNWEDTRIFLQAEMVCAE